MSILDLLFHRYIRTGETVLTYHGDNPTPTRHVVRLEGAGKYACVRAGADGIRRDLITRDAAGNWFYRFDD